MATALLNQASTSLIPEVYRTAQTAQAVSEKGSKLNEGCVAWVKAVFQSHPHLKGKAACIHCTLWNGCLRLSGVLPSYYLKQLAQEALKNQNHEFRIENQILVVCPEDEFQS